ncbi:unnamed protein product [Adineta steineri]|uniref:Peptidase A1 domain-containing protein n=1 Tax=Adineta steineri TaxID=433720 RepID=A0A819VW34_9BILA|nr:unnamed protein product [Adineta steineri]
MNSVYSLTSSHDEPDVNDLELQDMRIDDEKSPTMSKMKYEQDQLSQQSIGGGSRRSLQRISFPVARYNHRQLPLRDSFISFMPWTSIFADRRSRHTFIYSKSSVYVIPPLINRYGKRFSIAELIAAGYASFYSNGKRPSENFDIITIYQPSPLSGSRIPKINPRTGGFTGGMHTNYGSFSSSRYEEQEINIAHDSESEEDEEEEKEENTKHYSSKDSYNSDERPQPPSRSRSRPRYPRPSRRPVHSTRSTSTTTRSTRTTTRSTSTTTRPTRTTKRSSTATTTMNSCIGLPDISENSDNNKLKRIPIHKRKHRCGKNVNSDECHHWHSTIIQRALKKHSVTRKTANLTLIDDLFGQYWVGLVTVGTPGQPFYVLPDIGSADFWIPGPACGNLCGGTHVFNPNASSTYVSWDKDFFLSYINGASVNGTFANDTVDIGGISISHQPFAIVNSAIGVAGVEFDGILGMAYPADTEAGENPVIFSMYLAGKLKLPIFTFWFEPVPTGSDTGELILGSYDTTKFVGCFTYVPVSLQRHWQFIADSISLSVGSNTTTIATSFSAALDSGTSLAFIGPVAYVNNILEMLEAVFDPTMGLYAIDCHTKPLTTFPNITLTISGVPFLLTAPMYTLIFGNSSSYTCYILIQGLDVPDEDTDIWIFGTFFMNRFYTIFDMQKNRIGLARSSLYSVIQTEPIPLSAIQ